MTIKKKSLISKLNTTKKAIVASTPVAPSVSTSEGRLNARRKPTRAMTRKVLRRLG